MANVKARLIEQGNGLPGVGELVYHHDSDELYRIIRYSGIHTDGVRGNYVYADLEHDDSVLEEREYENFSVTVELLDNE